MSSSLGFLVRTMLAVLIAVPVALLTNCSSYDELVEKEVIAAEKWANVEAQLQRRHDLVPQLVAVVKGSAAHERGTLEAVIQARALATSVKLSADDLSDPAKMAAFQQAQEGLSSALSRLMVVQEQYPDLKANQSFRDLQVQLEGTENRLLRAREEYNAAVSAYNAALGRVRGQVVNKATGKAFLPKVFYATTADAQAAPAVSF